MTHPNHRPSRPRTQRAAIALALAAATMAGCATNPLPGLTGIATGTSTTNAATGAAAGDASANANTQLERCDSPLGTLALVENQAAGWYTILRDEYRLPPTANLLRLIVQQSNCFLIVERGAAGMRALERERALASSGEVRGGSNMGAGQMVAADYSLAPEIMFSNSDAGGVSGVVGALVGARNPNLARLAGGVRTKEATAMLTLVDNRSGVQVGVAEGNASKTDFSIGALFRGSSAGSQMGAYTNTERAR